MEIVGNSRAAGLEVLTPFAYSTTLEIESTSLALGGQGLYYVSFYCCIPVLIIKNCVQ